MNLPLWWVRSESEEGSNCYAAAFSSAALRMAAADFGCEDADDLEDLTVSPVTAADVNRLQEVIAGLRGQLDEAREAALDTANRPERLDNRLRWTSLPEIPEHYETVEVKLRTPHGEDEHTFGWRDDDGEWHCLGSDGGVPIIDADIIGWRPIIP